LIASGRKFVGVSYQDEMEVSMKKRYVVLAGVAALPITLALAQGTKTVSILGAFGGEEAKVFQSVINVFEAKNPGIKINYASSADFNTVLNVRVQSGDYPDITALPQPGVMKDLAAKGVLAPVAATTLSAIQKNYAPAWADLGRAADGKVYGVFHRVNVKGLVFYNKPAFEAAGYKVPKTWVELMALTKQMESSKAAPWCVGMESGGATGWVATDWIENIMLRTQPVGVYDKWIPGTVNFASPEVKNAFNILDSIWGNPKQVYGGRANIAATNFIPAAQGLFTNPSQCWLHMQGSFATAFFQDAIQKNLDANVGVFVLPMINTKLPQTALVGGDQFVMFKGKNRPEVQKFMSFLATGASADPWSKQGGGLFPHKDQNLSSYKTKLERDFASIILSAKAARFDASDAMPSAVNQAFWKGTTDWVTGADLDTVLKQIDAAYR
jgi:alpha-glucoside transport system substrate-binding protein